MTTIGTPFTPNATKVLLLGSGELGKELAIELIRYGIEVIAIDSYKNAPAMHVAQRHFIIDMTNTTALRQLIEQIKPNYIVPEIEAIATHVLLEFEQQGITVIPNATAVRLTMDRLGIRKLVAEQLKIPTSNYLFADDFISFQHAVQQIGLPCIVKPIMSSSGKGQSLIKNSAQLEQAWQHSQTAARTKNNGVMVESFIAFDYEITLLTVRHLGGTSFCPPIGHTQQDGDYQLSWQPQSMSSQALKNAQQIAQQVTDALGGRGVFGVELFVKGDQVWFNEISPRPHDTGMVTLIAQNLSEFALHARAILNLPIPQIKLTSPSASKAVVVKGISQQVSFSNLTQALALGDTEIRIFGKPQVNGKRRMAVILASATDTELAKQKTTQVYQQLKINLTSS